ncbi:nucleotide exchange factor GrpE [Clostridium perfringens]|uniref:nucleotide exchange factor GrpE n=1 Tax=Clostridium perfringens TaxID=1502 RepID=UPI001A270368|nr:nucleotide exchange factor GrpE [Clostridium perfringens]ELC8388296.1 nucleotide exchange factor GrpE [Clostridium perfringens]MDH5085385.1 heat shock protein GrpE [Clostridium perfringens]MDK0660506.1 nucleotide exchange factor GrpE [Clostridium perfringens]MDK0773050.1 nucleotide exchange factor GrpE [Clostridium perfringens]MDK0778242.1 nucleotide exchange factor GrpE [Clostridium perfringens]
MVDNKDFNEELKGNIQEELDNETKSENPNIDEEVEEVSEDIKADEKVIDFEELKALKEENTMFKSKTKKLENELEALKDRLLRISAEYENYRKRTDKEKERIYTDACEDVLIKMLPVLDNLERALAVDGTVEDLKKGVEMTVRQFEDALEKLQVEEISTENGFDPELHQAMMVVEQEGSEPNQVAQVFQKGYKRGDKVIRHSMVTVTK